MTFKDSTLQNLRQFELCIAAVEADAKAFRMIMETYILEGDKEGAAAYSVRLNLHEKLLNKLLEEKEEVVRKMDNMAADMNDLECRVFVLKYQEGKTNKEVTDILNISESYLYYLMDNIYKILKSSEDGQDIITSLSE